LTRPLPKVNGRLYTEVIKPWYETASDFNSSVLQGLTVPANSAAVKSVRQDARYLIYVFFGLFEIMQHLPETNKVKPPQMFFYCPSLIVAHKYRKF